MGDVGEAMLELLVEVGTEAVSLNIEEAVPLLGEEVELGDPGVEIGGEVVRFAAAADAVTPAVIDVDAVVGDAIAPLRQPPHPDCRNLELSLGGMSRR